jgi:hypothetical protein
MTKPTSSAIDGREVSPYPDRITPKSFVDPIRIPPFLAPEFVGSCLIRWRYPRKRHVRHCSTGAPAFHCERSKKKKKTPRHQIFHLRCHFDWYVCLWRGDIGGRALWFWGDCSPGRAVEGGASGGDCGVCTDDIEDTGAVCCGTLAGSACGAFDGDGGTILPGDGSTGEGAVREGRPIRSPVGRTSGTMRPTALTSIATEARINPYRPRISRVKLRSQRHGSRRPCRSTNSLRV